MIRWWIRRRLRAFERRYAYDMGYARDLLDATLGGFGHYLRVAAMAGYRRDVPPQPWFAAKLVGLLAEDCGPCCQLIVDLAREQGVPDATLLAVLEGRLDALPPDTALAVRYARAAVARAPELDAMHAAVRTRWGERGLAALALALTASRMFPMLKVALGHGQACTRLRVGDVVVTGPHPPARPLVHAA